MYSKVERAQQTVMLQEETTANSAGFVDNTGEEDTSAESFIDFEKMQEALRPYTILMPEEYRKERYEGELMGYYHPETKTYNITPQKLQNVRTDAAILGVASRKERRKAEQTISAIRVICLLSGTMIRQKYPSEIMRLRRSTSIITPANRIFFPEIRGL